MVKKKVTLSLDSKVYSDFQKYCEENAIMLSKKIELLIKEVVKHKIKKTFLIFNLFLFSLFLIASVNAAQIFFDGFESGGMSGWSLSHAAGAVDWTASTTDPFQGSYHAFGRPIDTDDPASTMERTISTSSYIDINFSYYRKLNLGTALHTFRAKWFDGSTWIAVEDVTGTIADSSYVSKSFLLPSSANNNANFAIKFECTEGTTTKDCNVDTVNISGTAIVTDTTPPLINIVYPENILYNINVSQLNYTVSDTNLQACWYSLNNGVSNTTIMCGNNATSLTSNEGSNTWRIWANDSAGNLNSSSVTFFKDTIYPLISYETGTENSGVNVSRNWIYVNVSFTEINFKNITFLLKNSSTVINSTTFTSTAYTINWTNLQDGDYYYNVSIYDVVGNFNSTGIRVIRLDTTGPLINIIRPEAKTYGYNTSLALNYTVSDVNLQNCWYKIINSTNNIMINNLTLTNCQNSTFNLSRDDSYTLYLYANDTLGNLNYATRSFTVNSQIAISLESPLDNLWLKFSLAQFNYTVDTATIVSNCSLYINGQLNQTNTSAINISGGRNKFNVNLADGNYIWNVLCTNTYVAFALSNYTLNIDTQNPSLNVFYPLNNSFFVQNISIPLNFSVSDANLASCWYNLGNNNHTISSCQNLTLSYLNDTYNLTLYANDSANNVASFVIYNITIQYDEMAPSLTLNEPSGTKTSLTGIPLQFSVSDNDIIECWYNLSSLDGTITKANTNLPNCASTTIDVSVTTSYNLFLTARDRTGNINYTNSSFSVSTSSPPPSSGGGSSGGGGGGGGTTNVSKLANLEISGLNDLIMNIGESQTLSASVKNIGKVFVNKCKLSGGGQFADWISSKELKGLAVGEISEFIFDLKVPSDVKAGEYPIDIFIICQEIQKARSFKVSILNSSFQVTIDKIEQKNNMLNVLYSVKDNYNKARDISVSFQLLNDDGKAVNEGEDGFALEAGEVMQREVNLELPARISGEHVFKITASSEDTSVSTEESVILGTGFAGLAIFNQGGGQIFTYIILIAAGIFFVFVIVKRIIKNMGKVDRSGFVKIKLNRDKKGVMMIDSRIVEKLKKHAEGKDFKEKWIHIKHNSKGQVELGSPNN